jgi:V/A-type H+-transporting ATPase subunit I
MTKVSITGHKNQLQKTIDTLYNMNLLDIEGYQGGELETGEPFEEAEELSTLLVDTRSLLSKLPEVEHEQDKAFELEAFQDRLDEIKKNVRNRGSEISGLETEISQLREKKDFFQKLRGIGFEYQEIGSTRTLESFIGTFDRSRFEEAVKTDQYEISEGEDASVVLYAEKHADQIESALQEAGSNPMRAPEGDFTGTPEEILEGFAARISDLEDEKEELESDYLEKSKEWRAELDAAENYLSERVDKAEAPLSFATTDKTFIAEGWIPEEKFNELGEKLHNSTDGKVHLQTEQVGDETPPTKYSNNRMVQPFESLTELVNTPKYKELDPSFMLLLTFPLMFGFMIGDAGYGLTTMAVFYGGMKMFPGAKEIFKSLMYASFFTILFGLAFGDAFGYVIFGHHSELAAVTGIHLFEKIPILFHRAEHLGTVFEWAVLIGFLHVNVGIFLGFYNDYVGHDLKHAFLENISWVLLEIGALAWYAFGMSVGAPILLISVVMLYVGEGAQGVVEIPGLLSNILSYLRIFGVSVAAVALAAVVNAMAEPLFHMGSPVGVALGVLVLVVGHVFNTFIKIMEGFLQGIRLHYVEQFGKFFEGGGRKYAPFGASNQ